MSSEAIEKAHSEYHALVTAIQMDCQREKEQIRQDNKVEMDHYVESHLEEDASEIMEKFALILNADIEALRGDAAMLIDIEKTRLQTRLQEILRHS